MRLILGALIGILALVLTACPEDVEELLDDEEEVEHEEIEIDEEVEAALDASCENELLGYELDYPSDWDVFENEELPPCSAFDEEEVVLDLEAEQPLVAAIQIRELGEGIDAATEDLDGEEVTVDGERAVVVEREADEDDAFEEGTQLYEYYIDQEATTLVATANDWHDPDEREEPDFEERRDVLDGMMASLTFVEREAPEAEEE